MWGTSGTFEVIDSSYDQFEVKYTLQNIVRGSNILFTVIDSDTELPTGIATFSMNSICTEIFPQIDQQEYRLVVTKIFFW